MVQRDVGLLQRGIEVRRTGANIAIVDLFDAGVHILHIQDVNYNHPRHLVFFLSADDSHAKIRRTHNAYLDFAQ